MAFTLVGNCVLQPLRDKFRGLKELEEQNLWLLPALAILNSISRSI